MKWAIVSPRCKHVLKKMQYAFNLANCEFVSRSSKLVKLHDRTVQPVALSAALADSSIDAVYIYTPTEHHEETVLPAIMAKKHVLVEKTPSMDPAVFLRCLQASTEFNVTLDVVFQPLFIKNVAPRISIFDLYESGEVTDGVVSLCLPLSGTHPNPI